MAIQKFYGYAPDVDSTTPGVITDCEMMEPSLRGMRSAPKASNTELTAFATACHGSALITKLDGTKRLFAGTSTHLYEASGGAWTDRSASTYHATAEARWDFAQFGNTTLAVNGIDAAQQSTSGAFSVLTAMPKAELVTVAAGFVMVANVTDASYAYSDAWWCSALYDHTSWAPSIATQAAQGRLLDSPGEIKALKTLGENVVAFKERSMFVGQYVGPDVIWSWTQVPGDIGAFSQSSVVSDGRALYFWGGDDFYRFDGTRPAPIGADVKTWFSDNAARAYWYAMLGDYDRSRSLVRWYFAPNGDSTPTACIVFNTITGRWGRADRSIEAVVDYISAAITYDSPGILAGVTYNSTSWPQSYDSPFWLSATESPAVVNTSHTLQTLTGISDTSSLTTGDFGDDDRYSLLRFVRPRYARSPTTASMTNYHKSDAGGSLTTDETTSANDGRFDVLQSARWHRAKFDWTGDVEVIGFTAEMTPEGEA